MSTRQQLFGILAGAVLGLVGPGSTITTLAVSVGSSDGVQFSQFNLDFSGGSVVNSGHGLVAVDIPALTGSTSISSGFLNVYDPSRSPADAWIVQNLPIDTASGLPGIGTMIDLNVPDGTSLGSMNLQTDFSSTPTALYAGSGPNQNFLLGNPLRYAAEGKSMTPNAPPAPGNRPNPNAGVFALPGFSATWQPGHPSVEQDTNQCGPASVANSLAWLRSSYGAAAPLNPALTNTPGIGGAVDPAASLVGKLDTAMGRTPHQPINDVPFMRGKLGFIDNAANGLKGKLVIKHWPGAATDGGVNDTRGNITVGATTSTDASAGFVGTEIDWIIQELQHGEDVEMSWLWAGGGGHWVDLIGGGYVLGRPWVAWVHDASQGHNTQGTAAVGDDTTALNGGTSWFDGGIGFSWVDAGGLLPTWIGSGGGKATMDLAASESIPEPAAALSLLVVGAFALLSRRQRRHGSAD